MDRMSNKKEYQARYREKNRAALNEKMRIYRSNLRKIVFDHYGRECAWCGFDDERALQIDHIENNGAEERKSLGGQQMSGWRFYQHLVKLELPAGYQTLCANCNNIKQHMYLTEKRLSGIIET